MPEKALGKGLDALIQKPDNDESIDTEDKATETETKKTSKKADTKKSKKTTKSSKTTENNSELSKDNLDKIRAEVEKNPRISLWSKQSAATLKYLKKTTPEFSISSEASLLLEEAIKEKYPEIWELFNE